MRVRSAVQVAGMGIDGQIEQVRALRVGKAEIERELFAAI